MRLTPEYTAGIIDGEGSIGIARTLSRGRAQHSLHVGVVNSYRPLVESLVETYGGVIRTRKPVGLSRKTQYEWRLYGPSAGLFLDFIQDYLFEKKNQSWLAREFLAQKRTGTNTKLSEEEVALRDGFYLALRASKV